MPPSQEQLIEAVLAFLNAPTWAESKQIVEKHRELLLTDAADAVFANLLEQYSDNQNATHRIEAHRNLLHRCRQEGIDAAFVDRLGASADARGSDLATLLKELQHLTEPGDMPRAVILYRAALELVSRDRQPELWAALQWQLGNSLVQNPLEKRAENLERAIHHYEQALEVYTREAFPERWATAQNIRAITASYHKDRHDKSQYAQEYAARIRDRLIEAHKELKQALRDPSQGEEQR